MSAAGKTPKKPADNPKESQEPKDSKPPESAGKSTTSAKPARSEAPASAASAKSKGDKKKGEEPATKVDKPGEFIEKNADKSDEKKSSVNKSGEKKKSVDKSGEKKSKDEQRPSLVDKLFRTKTEEKVKIQSKSADGGKTSRTAPATPVPETAAVPDADAVSVKSEAKSTASKAPKKTSKSVEGGERKSSIFNANKKKKGSVISSDPYQNAPPETPLTEDQLRELCETRIQEIQRCREDVQGLREQLVANQKIKEEKQKELQNITARHDDLRKQLAREFIVRDEEASRVSSSETQLAEAEEKKNEFDLRDRFAHHIQQQVHGDIGASLEGYSDYYQSLMFSKMKTLEVWHKLSQQFLEKTAAMNESHQKAKQAYAAVTSRYKKVKTVRDQLSAELRRLQGDDEREAENFQKTSAERRERNEQMLAKYRDRVQRCLVNRDLKYEQVLEAKDNLVAHTKVQMEALHKAYGTLENASKETVEVFDKLLELGKDKGFSKKTMKLIDALPLDTDYAEPLKKIQKTLSDYVTCVREIDTKRNDLLRERAALITGDMRRTDCCPCPVKQ